MKEFLIELIDNDTLIIIGLIFLAAFIDDKELARYVTGGFLGYMGKTIKGRY